MIDFEEYRKQKHQDPMQLSVADISSSQSGREEFTEYFK